MRSYLLARLVGLALLAGPACRSPEPAGASTSAAATPNPAAARPAAAAPARPLPPPSAAAGAQVHLDPASLAVIRAALASDHFADRLAAIEALADARHPVLVDLLGQALGDHDHDVRLAAVDGLTRLSTVPRARALLASVRDDPTEALDVRALAAGALLVPR